MRVLIVVTHLLGTGHLSRAATLAEGIAEEGHEVTILSGGSPAPHLTPPRARLIQLPPLTSDGVNYKRLLTPEGALRDEAYNQRRIDEAVAALEAVNPHMVITELFPFGRRPLAAEFEAIIEAARARTPRPLVYCSIRDILEPPPKPERLVEAEERLEKYFDGILVHSEEAVMPLERSWPLKPHIKDRLIYTGYVSPPLPPYEAEGDGAGEILVTAGGGPVGGPLFEAAAQAARLAPETRWRLLIGGAGRAERIAALEAKAGPAENRVIEPLRPDFRAMLRRAALSVNQAGYNTMLDLAASGARSVVVPFEEGGETEQRLRAEAFAARNGYRLLLETELSPETLAQTVAVALTDPYPDSPPLDLGGAGETARILSAVLAGRSA